jgi:hypothetical protein
LSELFESIETGALADAKSCIDELAKKAPDISELASARALIKRKEAIGR